MSRCAIRSSAARLFTPGTKVRGFPCGVCGVTALCLSGFARGLWSLRLDVCTDRDSYGFGSALRYVGERSLLSFFLNGLPSWAPPILTPSSRRAFSGVPLPWSAFPSREPPVNRRFMRQTALPAGAFPPEAWLLQMRPRLILQRRVLFG